MRTILIRLLIAVMLIVGTYTAYYGEKKTEEPIYSGAEIHDLQTGKTSDPDGENGAGFGEEALESALESDAGGTPIYPEDGNYIIYDRQVYVDCIDVPDGGKGSLPVVSPVWNSNTKIFSVAFDEKRDSYKITNNANHLVLDAGEGNFVRQWEDVGTDDQRWVFEYAPNGYAYIRTLSGKYLRENRQAGRTLALLDARNAAQAFCLARQINPEEGDYVIYSAMDPAFCLEVAGGVNAKNNGDNVQMWEEKTSGAKVFTIVRDKWDTYKIINKNSGLAVSVVDKNIVQWENKESDTARWTFEDAGNGQIYIRSMEGLHMSVMSGKTITNGIDVSTAKFFALDNQKFRLVKAGSSTGTFVSNGTVWIVVAAAVVAVGAAVLTIILVNKKKKAGTMPKNDENSEK